MKILISLISDQQIPNVLFIKEINPDRNIFVTTNAMENKRQSDKIINTLNITNVEKIVVNEESFDDIIYKLTNKVKITDKDELIINITGGNKIMSLASYYFGRRKGAKIYYLPINSNRFIKIYPETEPKEIEVKFLLTLEEYLNSYYKKTNEDYFYYDKPLKSEKEANNFLELYSREKLNQIIQIIRDNKGRDKNLKINEELGKIIKDLNIQTEKQDILSKYESRYITGEWFEEWVYYKIKNKFNLEEKYISISVNRQKKEDNVENEFDVMFVVNNKLGIIECKTSLKYEKEYDLFRETLYKSSSLIKDFGLNPKSFLFTLSPQPTDNKKKEDMIKEAKFFRIACFYKEDLLNNLENVLEEIKKQLL
ncbi:MAG: DUF1887 family CARF protein [Elusimicrobiales bacterium]|nr:DUF1887 family CARF protein [Elusimicrobiales bacterium]